MESIYLQVKFQFLGPIFKVLEVLPKLAMLTPTLATALLWGFIAPVVPRTSSGLQVVALRGPSPHQLNPTTPSKAPVNHPYISKLFSKFHSLMTLSLVSPPSKRMECGMGVNLSWKPCVCQALSSHFLPTFSHLISAAGLQVGAMALLCQDLEMEAQRWRGTWGWRPFKLWRWFAATSVWIQTPVLSLCPEASCPFSYSVRSLGFLW